MSLALVFIYLRNSGIVMDIELVVIWE